MNEQERKPESTHYANTDLKIDADSKPHALQTVFDRHGFFDMWERPDEEKSWQGCFETGEQYHEPDANIARFLSVIESLEEPALLEWQACTRREFDIGYSTGHEPFDFHQDLSTDTLSRIAKVGASLRITIYAPDKSQKKIRSVQEVAKAVTQLSTAEKVASDNAKELVEWASCAGLTVADCSSCKPD